MRVSLVRFQQHSTHWPQGNVVVISRAHVMDLSLILYIWRRLLTSASSTTVRQSDISQTTFWNIFSKKKGNSFINISLTSASKAITKLLVGIRWSLGTCTEWNVEIIQKCGSFYIAYITCLVVYDSQRAYECIGVWGVTPIVLSYGTQTLPSLCLQFL